MKNFFKKLANSIERNIKLIIQHGQVVPLQECKDGSTYKVNKLNILNK